LLETSGTWKLRDEKAPPPRKGSLITLDDDDSDDALRGGRYKGTPDGRRKKKGRSEVKGRARKIDEEDR
jgi:hypothetical protein